MLLDVESFLRAKSKRRTVSGKRSGSSTSSQIGSESRVCWQRVSAARRSMFSTHRFLRLETSFIIRSMILFCAGPL